MTTEDRAVLPLGRLGEVRIDFGSEHHQGARDVEILLPFPLAGATRFRTTNGTAWLSSDGSFLFMADASAVVRVDLASLETAHLLPPDDEYFAEFEESADAYRLRLYTGAGGSRWVTIEKSPSAFTPGLGPVVSGRFPSAHP